MPIRAAIRLTPSVSIHAPAEGATFLKGCVWGLQDVSIHAPAEGATVAS